MLVEGIGELVTNDPELGEGRLGLLRDAAVAVDGDRVVWAGPAGAVPEGVAGPRLDAAGAAVLPGFVDAHTHLVFAGDRTAEFDARMRGEPYAAGGIRTTVTATRAAGDEALRTNARRLAAEALRGGTTTLEVKSGYGLTVADEARLLRIAAGITEEVTFLGAHVVPPELAARSGRLCGPPLRRDARHVRTARALVRRVLRPRSVRRGRVPPDPPGRGRPWPRAAAAREPARARPGRAPRGRGRRRERRPPHVPDRWRRRRPRGRRRRRDPPAGRGPLDAAPVARRAGAARRRRPRRARDRLQPRHLVHDEHAARRGARRHGDADDARGGDVVGDRRRRGRAPAHGRRPGRPRGRSPISSCSTRRRTSTWPTGPARRSCGP